MRSKLLDDFLDNLHRNLRVQEDWFACENAALLQAIWDQSFQLIGLLNPDGTVIKINQAAADLINIKESDVVGKYFWDTPWWTHSPDLQRQVKEAVKSAAGGELIHLEATHPTRDGKLAFIDFSLKPIKDERGNVVLLVPEGRDITERKLAQEALQDAAIKYQIVADNTYNWEFWISPEERFIYSSPSCFRITGHSAEEFNSNPDLILSLIHPDDLHIWTNHRQDVTKTTAIGDIEFRIVRANNDIRWIHHVCIPVFNTQGSFLGTRGSFSDITQRKLAETRNVQLASIVESSDAAIVGKTIDGDITSWNKGAENIFGFTEQEVLGKPITLLIPDEYVNDVQLIHERIKRGEHVDHFETVRKRKNGELINMSLTYSPIKDALGRVIAVSAIGHDITAQKKASAALLENTRINRELEIAKEIQQSFLPVCPPELPGIQMTCSCIPAAHVGGDYYDFFPLENGVIDAVIADVTGHSVGSSLLMTMTRSVLHATVGIGRSPANLLTAVNNLVHNDLSRAELQISMFYVRLDTEKRTISYANAGQTPPLLFCAADSVFKELDAEGLLMGVKTDVNYEEKFARVAKGDVLVLYTDGITESKDPEGNLFGTGRLCKVVSEHHQLHPSEIMSFIYQHLSGFTLSDDVALLIIKFT